MCRCMAQDRDRGVWASVQRESCRPERSPGPGGAAQAGVCAQGCWAVSQQVWWGRLVSSTAVFASAFRSGAVWCEVRDLGMDRSDTMGGCQPWREFWFED